jgi:hypothetical protein
MRCCLLRKIVDRQEKCEAAGDKSFRPYGDGEFIARLPHGLIRCPEQHFPTVKSFRVTGGQGRFGGPQPHEAVKQFLGEPLLILLRCKVPHQTLHFLPCMGIAQRREKIR